MQDKLNNYDLHIIKMSLKANIESLKKLLDSEHTSLADSAKNVTTMYKGVLDKITSLEE